MKKKLIFLSASCLMASAAMAVSCILASSNDNLAKVQGSDDYYSITIDATKDITDSTETASGSFTVKTDQNKNDITFQYVNVTYNDDPAGVYIQGNEGGYIYNAIGNEVRGMNSITIKSDNSRVIVEWGYEESGDILYVSNSAKYVSPEGTEFNFQGDKPNFFKITSGAYVAPKIYEIVISYDKACEEGVNNYKVINGIKYIKENGARWNVCGFHKYSFADVVLETEIDGLPVEGIQGAAFKDNSTIESINLGHIKNIGYQSFYNCANLTDVGSLSNVIMFSNNCFQYCYKLTMESLTLGGNVSFVGTGAFQNANKIKEIIFEDDCKASVGFAAFRGIEELESVTIGKSMEYADDFMYCPKLETITVDPENEYCCAEDNILYVRNGLELTLRRMAQNRAQTNYVMPENVTSMEPYSCYGAETLESVVINDSIEGIPDNAFDRCSSLTSVTFGASVETIGNYSFANCGFVSLVIPSTIKTILSRAFRFCESLKTVEFEEGCTKLCELVFEGCDVLDTVVLPTSLDEVGVDGGFGGSTIDVFADCSALSNVFTLLAGGNYEHEVAGWYGPRVLNYYSETYASGCWHYVDGVPVLYL